MGLSSKQVDEDTLNRPQMEGSEIPKASKTEKAPPLKCPRCYSINTKFCYYNNYSLTQPRHLCRTCRRHWTAGGTLRNIPVSGSRRKNKRQNTAAAGDFPATSKPAVVENSDGFGILLAGNFRPLEFEFGKLSSGFSFYEDSTSKSAASVSIEESVVFPADFLDFWDGGL